MKALLKTLYFFLLLIVLFLLIGVFLPKGSQVGSSIIVNSSSEIIFDQINLITRWGNWVPWSNIDSASSIEFGDITEGKGASYTWLSPKTGPGTVTITESNPKTKVVADFVFEKQGNSQSIWTLKNNKGMTVINWEYRNPSLKYFERYFVVFFKKNLIQTMDVALQKLKETCQDLRLDRISDVKEVMVPQKHSIVIYGSCSIKDLETEKNKVIAKLSNYMQRRKIEPIDKPFTIFMKKDSIVSFACGMQIPESTWSWEVYQYYKIDSCRAIMIEHWGKTESNKPYMALTDYMNENKLIVEGNPWEISIVSPETEPDTSKWQTEIYYPVTNQYISN